MEDRNTKGKKDESYFDHEAEFETSIEFRETRGKDQKKESCGRQGGCGGDGVDGKDG